jgi:hypothetical protein
MAQIRISQPIGPNNPHRCDLIELSDYEMEEVLLPASVDRPKRKAVRVTVHGRNLKAVAQPLLVYVGGELLRFIRIAPDERSVEGILMDEPKAGAHVEVHLGDQDATRHPLPVDPAKIKRLPATGP